VESKFFIIEHFALFCQGI